METANYKLIKTEKDVILKRKNGDEIELNRFNDGTYSIGNHGYVVEKRMDRKTFSVKNFILTFLN